MSNFTIGKYVRQPGGHRAFILEGFPPTKRMLLPKEVMRKHTEAIRLLGKLDGTTEFLPDRDVFLLMFIKKDASSSSQIEGTNATMRDVIEKSNAEPRNNIPEDVDDIIHYINALNYGIERAQDFPLSLRFIRELHEKLMIGARSTHLAYPGQFRITQNWIGGTSPDNARFVPPPAEEMISALSDLEVFIHADDEYLPLIKAGLLHAQFEAIHPFVDGNGRTGRMLITMYLWRNGLLGMPILYLSEYFKKHRQIYYDMLERYCNGHVFEWLNFFLDGVIVTAKSALKTCVGIVELRERDMNKMQSLGKTSASSTLAVLRKLFEMPIVGIADILEWTGFSAPGGYKMIDRLIDLGILAPVEEGAVYGQKWMYREYLRLFGDGDNNATNAIPITDEEVVSIFQAFVNQQVDNAFRAFTDDRANAGVVIAQAVKKITFHNRIVHVIFDPVAVGINLEVFNVGASLFPNLAEFAGVPIMFNDDLGKRLRPVIDAVEAVFADGSSLGILTKEELYKIGTGEDLY
jgi:Fic family protein